MKEKLVILSKTYLLLRQRHASAASDCGSNAALAAPCGCDEAGIQLAYSIVLQFPIECQQEACYIDVFQPFDQNRPLNLLHLDGGYARPAEGFSVVVE